MDPLPRSPIAVYQGPFGEHQAARLLWRAGFGPQPGQARRLASLGLEGAVRSLTRPAVRARLIGKPPHNAQGAPLDPVNVWGDGHCWWLDRMVRTNQPLIERMTLIWHSWFATSVEASTAALMLGQNRMMRSHALGNFHALLIDVTRDPAMLLWLSNGDNTKYSPNENYAREMMELFTLGADRGAYTQRDVHEQARALTGFTYDWNDAGPTNFRLDPTLHDSATKTIFGHRGNFDWRDSCRLCVQHPLHPSFLVMKLWSYFMPTPPGPRVARALERTYVQGGYELRPLVEAILRHPLLYRGPRMVIPPVVYCAGMLRALRRTVITDDWSWICEQAGQLLFDPPNVAGWDYGHWLDTSRWAARFVAVNYALQGTDINTNTEKYAVTETAAQAVRSALRFWGDPPLSPQARRSLYSFSVQTQRSIAADWEQVTWRVLRQNALRALIPTTPDWQAC